MCKSANEASRPLNITMLHVSEILSAAKENYCKDQEHFLGLDAVSKRNIEWCSEIKGRSGLKFAVLKGLWTDLMMSARMRKVKSNRLFMI